MKVAVASPDIKWEDKIANRKICEGFVRRAAAQDAEIIIFPEMTLTGFSMNTALIAEKKEASATFAFFCALARRYGLAVIFGVVWKSGAKTTNDLVCLDKNGCVQADYAKIHPFSYTEETRFCDKGDRPVSCKLGGFQFSFSICYDLRFPEIFSALAPRMQVIVNIANWPRKRMDHWYALLKARAIENQCYAIGVNRTGTDGCGVVYEKSSAVFDANGGILSPVFSTKKLDFYLLNLQEQGKFRKKYPFLNDRRPHFYRSLYR